MSATGLNNASGAIFIDPSSQPNGNENDWMHILIPVYIFIITVLGFVLNVFVLMVFCLHKKACTVAEIYLTNLAAADVLLMCFLPLWAVNVYNGFEWMPKKEFCQAFYVGIYMNAYCSIFFLVLVSVDRYLAIVHPISLESLRRPVYAKVSCFCVWIVGFLLSIPSLIYKDVKPGQGCTTTPAVIETKVFIFSFIIPIIIISFCTINILRTLRKRSKNHFNIKKSDYKATTLILCVLLAFMICWIPYFLTQILNALHDSGILTDRGFIEGLEICKQIFPCLAVFNSVLNPLLYVLVGKNFRNKVKELFLRQSNERRATTGFASTRTYLTNSVRT